MVDLGQYSAIVEKSKSGDNDEVFNNFRKRLQEYLNSHENAVKIYNNDDVVNQVKKVV